MTGIKRGHATGIVVLQGGRIMGGDSFFAYTGSYAQARGKWRGSSTRPQLRFPGARGHLRLYRDQFGRRRRNRWLRVAQYWFAVAAWGQE